MRHAYGFCQAASIQHMIRLKEAAGRPQDLADVARLKQKLREPDNG